MPVDEMFSTKKIAQTCLKEACKICSLSSKRQASIYIDTRYKRNVFVLTIYNAYTIRASVCSMSSTHLIEPFFPTLLHNYHTKLIHRFNSTVALMGYIFQN